MMTTTTLVMVSMIERLRSASEKFDKEVTDILKDWNREEAMLLGKRMTATPLPQNGSEPAPKARKVRHHKLSAAGRRAISIAQKARWAKLKAVKRRIVTASAR